MMKTMNTDKRRSRPLLATVALLTALASHAQPASANEVLKWNETTVKVIAVGGQNPIQQTRSVAMVQGAVHDALNGIKPRHAPYYFEGVAAPGAAAEAAVAAATRTVLLSVIPAFGAPPQRAEALAQVEDAYRLALAALADGPAKQAGVAIGQAAGEAMLALREDDGATRPAAYTPASGPGRWRPHPNPEPPNPPIKDPKLAPGFAASMLPGWGHVTPFTLLSTSQYWLPGPPALTSAQYAQEFNEVKMLGGQLSSARTPEQTEISRFWFEGPGAWYRVARAVAEARGLDAWDRDRKSVV